MNSQFNRTISSKLATIAMLGCSCYSSLIFGQQLTPVSPAKAPSLPPIVRASDLKHPDAKPLPPVVPVAHAVLPEATRVELEPTDPVPPITTRSSIPSSPDESVLGEKFPENASDQIAEFIRANSNNVTGDIETMTFVNAATPEANQPSMANTPMVDARQQDVTAGDVPSNPTSEHGLPTPGLVTPFDVQTETNSEAWAMGQSDPALPLQNHVQSNSSIANQHAEVPSAIFEQHQAYGVNSEYGESTWSPPIDHGYSGNAFTCCGFICDSPGYFIADAMSWIREDGIFRAGNFTTFNDYDWTGGGRITIGKRRDSTRGWEASYTQADPWLSVNSQQNAAGLLNGFIGPSVGGLPASAFTAFRDSISLEQIQKSDFIGAEVNKTYWGADVAKAFIGARFIYMDDEFRLSSTNLLGESGVHSLEFENNMFGVHVGGELLYDMGYRIALSASAKLGGYANFYQGRTVLVNDNVVHVNISRSDTDFSGSGEAGVYARLKLGPRSRLRIGYEAMGLYNIYEAESNFNPFVRSSSGTTSNDGGAIYQGAVIGFEVYR